MHIAQSTFANLSRSAQLKETTYTEKGTEVTSGNWRPGNWLQIVLIDSLDQMARFAFGTSAPRMPEKRRKRSL